MTGAGYIKIAVGAAIVSLLLLSGRYVATFPQRISVLPSLQVDAGAYDAIALNLSQTWSLDAIPPLQPPGFVTFLAVLFALAGHSWVAGRLALWACLVVATCLSGLVARDMYRRAAAGWCAALLCALSPALRAYAGTLQYELLASVLLLALLWGAKRSLSPRPVLGKVSHATRLLLLGVGAGIAVLTREVFAAVAVVIAAYCYARLSAGIGRRVAALVAAGLLTVAAALPAVWSTVQSSRAGRVVAVSEKGPLVLAFGNNPLANGTFNAPLAGVGEPSGWAFIRSSPRDAAWLAYRKVLYFWGVLRDGWNVPRSGAIVLARTSAGVVPLERILPWVRGGGLLLLLAVALSLWPRETWRDWWLAPAAILAIMAIHVVTVSSHRFAVPVLPLAFAIIAGPVAHFAVWLWLRPVRRVATVSLLALVLVMQFGSWPMVYVLAATEFDGFAAENRLDAQTGGMVRFADPAKGRRAVLLLTDEYFPAGAFDIYLSARADEPAVDAEAAAFRVAVLTLDGQAACDRIVTAGEIGRRGMSVVAIPCSLQQSGPSTFIVETLGTSPLTFWAVRFVWTGSGAASLGASNRSGRVRLPRGARGVSPERLECGTFGHYESEG